MLAAWSRMPFSSDVNNETFEYWTSADMVFPFGLGERLTVRTQLQVLQRQGAQRLSLPCARVLKWDGLKEAASTCQRTA